MNKRKYHGVAGAALFAGCSGDGGTEPVEGGDDRDGEDDSPTATAPADGSPEDAPAAEDTDTPPDTDAKIATDEPTGSATPEIVSDELQVTDDDYRTTAVVVAEVENTEDAGDSILEIGCGPGVNFATIRDAIGMSGYLVAIDYSPKMVKKADERVKMHGWENMDVVRADATTADLGGPYDAAIATRALSVMPDIKRAVQNINSALKPGAPLGVLDIQEFQYRPLRVFNPLLKRFLRWYANWNPNENVRQVIEDVFGRIEPLDTFLLDAIFTKKATRADP